MVQQREQILKLQQVAQSGGGFAAKEVIQVENVQKVKELDSEDRLRVLEYLVRQMIDAKEEVKQQRHYDDDIDSMQWTERDNYN